MEIKWQRNKYLKFYAKMKIRLGGNEHSYTFEIGEEFEFDGTICKYSGTEFSQPGLRKAISNGWATVSEDDVSAVASFQPDRAIASAVSVNRDLSKVALQPSRHMETDSLDEETVVNVSDRGSAMKDPSRGHLKKADNRRASTRGLSVSPSESDDQGGVVISRLRTSTHEVVDVSKNPGRARELENLSSENGFGVVEREGVSLRTNVKSMQGSNLIQDGDVEDGTVVGSVRQGNKVTHSDGVQVTDTSAIRNTPVAVKVQSQTTTEPTGVNSKLATALSVYPKFPTDWNFFAKTEDKLVKVEALGASKQLVQALYATESKPMKKLLKDKYPTLV